MSGSRRENAYVNFDLFVPIFLQMYSIVPCSKSYESRFFIFTQFWGENVIERGTCLVKDVF